MKSLYNTIISDLEIELDKANESLYLAKHNEMIKSIPFYEGYVIGIKRAIKLSKGNYKRYR
jgi:hypothetical protein